MSSLTDRILRQLKHIRETLWLDELYLKRRWYIMLMRVLAIMWRGIFDNSLFNRAAALSYSSMLALAPILGVVVLLSSSFLRVNPEQHIKQALIFIAPTLEQYVGDGVAATPDSSLKGIPENKTPDENLSGTAADAPSDNVEEQKKDMEDAFDLLIRHMVTGVSDNLQAISKSGKSVAGLIGAGVLIWMGITLLVAIEDTMNRIWGVKRGRGWGRRLVLYWALLCLGILAALALVGLSSATTLGKALSILPFGSYFASIATDITSVLLALCLTFALTFFYKFFPNTTVRLGPAVCGAAVVAILLVINNKLSIMYISKVLTIQSLFGSVGIILVLMFSLYLFWAFLLFGGQLTYAVQNAQFLADQKAWENASERARETIAFATFALVARRFVQCKPALSADSIAETLRAPSNIINDGLTKLCEMGLLTALAGEEDETAKACFTPARPLKSVTFSEFRRRYAALGVDRGVEHLRKRDPLVDLYRKRMEEATATISQESVETLLDREKTPEKKA